jgi:outer membrane receptor protein involved in Fe transport
VHSWWQFNTTFAYDVYKNTTVRFIVDNVFDREPPFPALAGAQGFFLPRRPRSISRASSGVPTC